MRPFFWLIPAAALALPAVLSMKCPRQAQETGAATPAATQQPATKPAPPTPIAIKKAELGDDNTWDPDWDQILEKELPPELLSSRREHQVKALCPRFSRMSEPDRRAFWAYFFQALAGAEAGLKSTADVRHRDPEVAIVDPVTHRIARQEGLLQLKYYDSERYGCDFDWDKDKELPEHDPGKTILQPHEQSRVRHQDSLQSAVGSTQIAAEQFELLGHTAASQSEFQGVHQAARESACIMRAIALATSEHADRHFYTRFGDDRETAESSPNGLRRRPDRGDPLNRNQSPNRSRLRARAFAASSSRFRGGALVSSR